MPNKKVKLFISAKIQPLSNKAMVYKSSSQQPLLTFDRNNSILHPTVAPTFKSERSPNPTPWAHVRTHPHKSDIGSPRVPGNPRANTPKPTVPRIAPSNMYICSHPVPIYASMAVHPAVARLSKPRCPPPRIIFSYSVERAGPLGSPPSHASIGTVRFYPKISIRATVNSHVPVAILPRTLNLRIEIHAAFEPAGLSASRTPSIVQWTAARGLTKLKLYDSYSHTAIYPARDGAPGELHRTVLQSRALLTPIS